MRQIAVAPSKISAKNYVVFNDLYFQKRPIQRYSSRGTPFVTLEAIGMPRIPPTSLNVVSYLYHSKADALAGKDFGGTAFFVGIEAEVPGRAFFYAVTNWHVACRDGASVLRINSQDGCPDIFEYGPEDWVFDPHYDIAVCHINLNREQHVFSVVQMPNGIVKPEDIERVKLGPGEDVFMVGRFIDHDGGASNRPAVRFGNISVMPAPIEQPNGGMADCYCIDLHSRSGYSGSPVFVYRTPGYELEYICSSNIEESNILLVLALLGIHFAQFPEQWEIGKEAPPKTESSVPLIRTGEYVKGLSGMTCLLPAWHIWEVLNTPELKTQRELGNANVRAELISQGKMPPVAESVPLASDENPTHREDFTALLNAAARKREPKD